MPYVITTTTPDHRLQEKADRAAKRLWSGEVSSPAYAQRLATQLERSEGVVSRVAVATLEEARENMSEIIGDVYSRTGDALDATWCAFLDAKLPGSVGPLPDGTIIEVQQVDWATMYRLAGINAGPIVKVMEAFNGTAFNAS